MKILYISQFFYPEICAPTNRALANVKYLSETGHNVEVITEMPNHPRGKIFKQYKGKAFCREKLDGFVVNRVWVHTSPKKNFINRILFYISFMINASLVAIFKWKKYDLVYISSPPLFVAGIGFFIKFFHPKTPIIFGVRDVWPDSAVELNQLRNPKIIKIFEKIESRIYRISSKVIVISEKMKKQIIRKGVEKDKIEIIYNGTDLDFINKKNYNQKELEEQFGRNDELRFIYAGNIGIAQDLERIIKAFDGIPKEKYLFMILGAGPHEEKIKEILKSSNEHNIHFLGEISRELIHEYLSFADVGIIPLKKLPLFEGALPSKIFDYMGRNLAILLGVLGEAEQLIKETKTGICYEPDNIDDLNQKIKYCLENKEKIIEYGKNGRNVVLESFTRNSQAKKLEKIILKVVK